MNRVFNMTKHFLRVQSAYKTTFLLTLFIPVGTILFSMSEHLFTKIDIQDYMPMLILWVSFIILSYCVSNIQQCLLIRDQSFLKMFTLLSGNHLIVILGELFCQYLLMIFSGLILSLLSTILFGVSLLQVGIFTFLFCTISYWIVAPLFLIFLRISIQFEQFQPISYAMIFIIILTMNSYNFNSQTNFIMQIINPMVFVLEIGKLVSNFLLNIQFSVSIYPLIGISILYFAISYWSLTKTKIIPEYRS